MTRFQLKNRRWKLIALLVIVPLIAAAPAQASPLNHPAPSVLHDYILSMTGRALTIESYLRVSPELVPEVYRKIDLDGDGATSESERQNWLTEHASKVSVTLDGTPLQLQMSQAPSIGKSDLVASIDHPIRVDYTAALATPVSGKHRIRITYGDNYVAYDEYYLSVAGDIANDNRSVSLSQPKYPATYQVVYIMPTVDQANNVPSGQLAIAPYTAGTATPQPVPTREGATAPLAGVSSSSGQLFGWVAAIRDNIRGSIDGWRGEIWGVFGLLLLAVLLGALHALTPGHGKTMVGAYLIGTKGRASDAILLGAVVTITHTIGVFALGLILLFASNFVLPRAFQPTMELISGLLIVVLGGYLLLVRLRELRPRTRPRYLHSAGSQSNNGVNHIHDHTHDADQAHSHGVNPGRSALVLAAKKAPAAATVAASAQQDYARPLGQRAREMSASQEVQMSAQSHAHDHSHDAEHNHGHDGHSHGGHYHVHPHAGRPLGRRTLIGLGISGGIVPCPDAIAILLIAGVGRIGLGMGLVAAFSLGLAAVLIIIGLALVKMKGALERSRQASLASSALWTRWIPVLSAVVVVLMGIFIVLSSLSSRWS